MKIISYSGIDAPAITIERPTDLYPALDWIHTQMCDHMENGNDKNGEFKRCAAFISKLMDKVEENGFGNYDDIESVEY